MSLYCIDTCSFTWAMRDAYPLSILPPFWNRLNEEVLIGSVISTEMVLREIQKQDDDLHDWCKTVPALFQKMDQATLNRTAEIVRNHPKMVDPKKDRDGADPFLIALASVTGAVIVTQEKSTGGQGKKIKIPDVAASEGIRCITMLQMVKEFGWVFR